MCRVQLAQQEIEYLTTALDTFNQVAKYLGVNSAHISKLMGHSILTPTLDNALVEKRIMEPRPTRTRLAIDCERSTRRRFRDEAAAQGMTSEQYLIELMEVFKNEYGY